jgi:nitrogen regulatory protein P-II 1
MPKKKISGSTSPNTQRSGTRSQNAEQNLATIQEERVKLVVGIIKPFRLDEVKSAVQELGVQGMTVSEVQGFGRQRGHKEVYRGAEYTIDFVPKVKLEILVDDGDATAVAERLIESARTGKIGDGKVWILPVEGAFRIRTGEAGADAL